MAEEHPKLYDKGTCRCKCDKKEVVVLPRVKAGFFESNHEREMMLEQGS